MQISLQSSARRKLVLGIFLLISAAYTVATATQLIAELLSQRQSLESVRLASKLQPGNAEYFNRIGDLCAHSSSFFPAEAVAAYEAAVRLNPYKSRYWLNLADVYQSIGDINGQSQALDSAVSYDPLSPDTAWQAANQHIVMGKTDRALGEIRTVLRSDSAKAPAALAMAWKINPDIDSTLRDVIPPDPKTFVTFLHFLMDKQETSAAQKTWQAIINFQKPIDRPVVFDYIRYLLAKAQVDQAITAWQVAGTLSDLSNYQPTPHNMIVNGGFDLDVLNGGFDWHYNKSSDVNLALDPTQPFSGARSLRIKFDSRSLQDAGIAELIPVQPNSSYEFSGYFKAENIEGAGGPRIVLQDAYDGSIYFGSDFLKNSDQWKQIDGSFATGAQAKLLVLRVQRLPEGSPIRGKLWLDDLRLVASSQ